MVGRLKSDVNVEVSAIATRSDTKEGGGTTCWAYLLHNSH